MAAVKIRASRWLEARRMDGKRRPLHWCILAPRPWIPSGCVRLLRQPYAWLHRRGWRNSLDAPTSATGCWRIFLKERHANGWCGCFWDRRRGDL